METLKRAEELIVKWQKDEAVKTGKQTEISFAEKIEKLQQEKQTLESKCTNFSTENGLAYYPFNCPYLQ